MQLRKWFVPLVIISTFSVGAVAQDGQSLVDSANAAYQSEQYADCVDLYASAIEQGADAPRVFYNAACCCALSGDIDRAFQHLDNAIGAGYHNSEWIREDSDLQDLRADDRWADLIKKADSANEVYLNTINRELYWLYRRDQDDRTGGNIDWSQVAQRDSERRGRVRQLLDSGYVTVSDDYYHAAMIFQHGDDTTDYKLARELALKAVELDSTNGNAKWLSAAAKDRYLWNAGQPQWYGTQYHMVDGKWTIEPIDTTAVNDSIRREWEVPPLAEMRSRMAELNGQGGE